MDLKLKLYSIDQKLDKDDCSRVERRRLLRQKAAIEKRLSGMDALYFIGAKTGRVDSSLDALYQTKKCVIKILEALNE